MLVLSRKQGERIKIGDDIVLTVTHLSSKSVRIGIEAPGHVNVLRGELDDAFGNADTDIIRPDELEDGE